MSSDSVSTDALFSEEDQALAISAHNNFVRQEYDSCLGVLKKLQKGHPGDAKLMHNRTLTEFLKSNQTKLTEFKKNLSKAQILTQKSRHDEEDSTEDGGNVENVFLLFNQALLFYKLHQYSEAQANLEMIIDDIENKTLQQNVFILLIDVLIITHQPERAIQIINKVESLLQSPGKSPDPSDKGAVQNRQQLEKLKNKLPFLKTKCFLQMKSMKACKRELKTISNYLSPTEQSSSESHTTENIIANFLKSKFEFQRGNFLKAYRLLGCNPPTSAANTECISKGECPISMYYNNLGVIYSSMHKHNIGSYYLVCALDENDKAFATAAKQHHSGKQSSTANNQKHLSMLNMNLRHQLLYNAGMQLLHAGKASAAFDCLLVAVQVYYNNPRLWLRLAECCIQTTYSGKLDSNKPNSIKYSLIGNGTHRKLIITEDNHVQGGNGNSVMPIPTIDFASICLQNALVILNDVFIDKSAKKKSSGDSKILQIPSEPGPPISGSELEGVQASILLNSAFVALQLGNNLMAHEHASNLLKLPNITGYQKYLGKTYAAEALVYLDKISDAIEHLNISNIPNIKDEGSSGKGSSNTGDEGHHNVPVDRNSHFCLKSTQHSRACMLVNLAISHSFRSEFEKSEKLLQQAYQCVEGSLPKQAVMLSAYLSLHKPGGAKIAEQVLKTNSVFPKNNFDLNPNGDFTNSIWPANSDQPA